MPLHYATLKAAVAKYKDTAEDKLRAAIEADEKQFTLEEVDEIMAAVTARSAPPSTSTQKPVVSDINADLDLKDYDYNNLTGDSFKKYMEMFSRLDGHKNRDFVQYMASGIFKMEHDENLEKVEVLVGIKINKIEPVNRTRIPVALARDLNAQIHNRNNPPSNSRYYLLKK